LAADRRNSQHLREDLLCAYLVLRELRDYAQHYSVAARRKMVARATAALQSAWQYTGAELSELEPQMLALLASGDICRRHLNATD
jgi:multidrug resistance efflux pump